MNNDDFEDEYLGTEEGQPQTIQMNNTVAAVV